MNIRNGIYGVLLIGLAGSAMADGEANMNMAIEVVGDDATTGKHFMIKSDDLGFELEDLQIGESRSIVDESGQNILVTRVEEGFSFNIDGETIEMPDFQSGEHGGIQWVAKGDEDVNIHVIRDVNVATMREISGTMVMSSTPIDAVTQQAIKSLLESAGYGSEVNFIDHEGAEDRRVMIKKSEM